MSKIQASNVNTSLVSQQSDRIVVLILSYTVIQTFLKVETRSSTQEHFHIQFPTCPSCPTCQTPRFLCPSIWMVQGIPCSIHSCSIWQVAHIIREQGTWQRRASVRRLRQKVCEKFVPLVLLTNRW